MNTLITKKYVTPNDMKKISHVRGTILKNDGRIYLVKTENIFTVWIPEACASSPFIGQWNDRNYSSVLTVKANCEISDLRCTTRGTFTIGNGNSFSLDMDHSNSGMDCLPNGQYACDTTGSTSTYLRVTCQGVGTVFEYDKI